MLPGAGAESGSPEFGVAGEARRQCDHIDGAFSQAYGDHGYTLVIESDRTFLARHHHFESVGAAARDGVDIIPTIASIREFEKPRLVGDTEEGASIREDIALLTRLVQAYRHHKL